MENCNIQWELYSIETETMQVDQYSSSPGERYVWITDFTWDDEYNESFIFVDVWEQHTLKGLGNYNGKLF